jgi:hypothetical protein
VRGFRSQVTKEQQGWNMGRRRKWENSAQRE